MSDNERFKTRDLSLASGLSVLSGIDPCVESDKNNKVVFVFDDQEKWIGKTIAAYHSGASGSLVDFATKYRELKALMFTQKAAGQ
jgi:hypothetical protein